MGDESDPVTAVAKAVEEGGVQFSLANVLRCRHGNSRDSAPLFPAHRG